MGDYYQTKKETELGVLIAVVEKQTPDKLVKEHLDELAFLAKTLDIKIRQTFVQKIERPDKRTYVGSGKLEEIQSFIKMEKIDLIIFDDELSPSQLRNIENEVKGANGSGKNSSGVGSISISIASLDANVDAFGKTKRG